MGVLALVVAALIVVGFSVRQRTPVATVTDGGPGQAGPSGFARLSTRVLGALQEGPTWITFLIGVIEVNCRRDNAMFDGQDTNRAFNATSSAQQMTGH